MFGPHRALVGPEQPALEKGQRSVDMREEARGPCAVSDHTAAVSVADLRKPTIA